MPQLLRRQALTLMMGGAAGILAAPGRSWARQDAVSVAGDVDAHFQKVMAAFPEQPGLAVAVVENGAVSLAKGYGVLRAGEAAPVTDRSLFAIASNSKAYTAALLAMLVEEGRLEWDAPVVRYMPDFAMSDPLVTAQLSVRDLLCHRSGLSLGAGDLMLFPETTHTREELAHGLRYLPLTGTFRGAYAYDNVLYVVAGELIRAVSGQTWEEMVQARILGPLGMTDSAAGFAAIPAGAEMAWPHARLGPPVRGAGPLVPLKDNRRVDVAAAAGGLYCSVRDHAKWVATQLGLGQMPGGPRLWSEDSARAMWRPEILVRSMADPSEDRPDRSPIQTYALGWYVETWRGRKLVWHTGGIDGFITLTLMIPGLNRGLVVLTNAEETGVIYASRMGGPDALQPRSDFDWIAYSQRIQAAQAEEMAGAVAAVDAPANAAPPSLPLEAYLGTYRDPWYGTVTVRMWQGGLWVSFDKTPAFDGPLEAFDGDSFATHWPEPGLEDALITFEVADGAVTGALARALSPTADFSYDFQDLRLTRE